jgi:hypothetical protein
MLLCGERACQIAEGKFWQASKSFAVFLTVARENAALQRGWRDFRIAQ